MLLILGLSALVAPLIVAQKLVRKDVPLMIAASLLFWGLAADGQLSRTEGLVLFCLSIAYTVLLIRTSRRERTEILAEYQEAFGHDKPPSRLASLGRVVLGSFMLVEGSRMFVDAAVVTARLLGVSELVVGLSIVALGTSLPELATSLMAVSKGERDIAVGTVIGSNLSNSVHTLEAPLEALANQARGAGEFEGPRLMRVVLADGTVMTRIDVAAYDRLAAEIFAGYRRRQ